MAGVEERLRRIRERITHAAERVGRDPGSVLLIGATKEVDAARLRDVLALGLRDFGENRIQEARAKITAVGPGPRWHFIGHLQRNKAKAAVEHFSIVHSIDSLAIAQAVDRAASAAGRPVEVLVEVNVGAETMKYGAAPAAVEGLVRELGACDHLIPIGLMTVAPMARDPEVVRPSFRGLRVLRDRLRSGSVGEGFRELSMGMSDDFEVAIEEGATMVRIGRAIFGDRT
ncbi:MAG: YggS family pyridoxal phosphate-dependent enzyme [Armatimonadota bacterium]